MGRAGLADAAVLKRLIETINIQDRLDKIDLKQHFSEGRSLSNCKKIAVALRTRRDGVVPFAVESVGAQLNGGKLRLAHLDPFRVFACVQPALNANADVSRSVPTLTQSAFCPGS